MSKEKQEHIENDCWIVIKFCSSRLILAIMASVRKHLYRKINIDIMLKMKQENKH